MIKVVRYSGSMKRIWNEFNKHGKNSIFMFDRNYMDYHQDRFMDHSLMFYDDDKLVALLPMNESNSILYSHGGLTYGGFITDLGMKQHLMNECFDALLRYSMYYGFIKIIYKTIPYIYFKQSSEEDRYALFAHGAKLNVIDASTYINLNSPIKMSKGRKAQISRAKRESVEIRELTDDYSFNTFIDLENSVLEEKHHTHAVHTGAELKLLHDRFPNNIHLLGGFLNNKLIAGTVVFEYDKAVHIQYMAADETARKIGGLDLVVNSVIEQYKGNKNWMDFGISTEHGRIYLNDGLISQKEGFGGRTGVYSIWELDTNRDSMNEF